MKIKNISIKGAHNKPILLDVCYEKSNIKKPLVVFCHGYKGYKDWGAFDLMSDYFVKNDLFLLKFNFSHNGGTAENPIDFAQIVQTEIERIQTTTGIFTREYPENLIHFSALPWINFTSLSHARSFSWPDSCPKISYGKLLDENGKKTMPISIHVHHGLVDGYHVGLFLDRLQQLMNE